MADNAKQKKQYDDWRNQAFAERANREAARRRNELWEAINKFVIANGAWVVSLPNAQRIRIEIRQGSNLVSKLTEFGYSPTYCGTGTRIASGGTVETITERGKQTTRLHDGVIPVDIIEISLGK